jgi:hypothetical protein
MTSFVDLARGIVVETNTRSWTGPLFYSDKAYSEEPSFYFTQHPLNEGAKIPVIGIAAGITRMALATIHTLGHLFVAVVKLDKGHLYHAAKGGCEFLRGFIEAIPFAGRSFARYYYEHGYWWIIKIYNPDFPDSLDRHENLWSGLKKGRPTGYVMA